MPPKPNNYLVWSILATVLCCLPLGVVAILKSCAVDNAYNAGNMELAMSESQNAKKWCIIAAGSGVVISGISLLFVFLSAALGN